MVCTMNEQLKHTLKDPFYLPTLAELKEAFPVDESYRTDSKDFSWLSPDFTKFQYQINNYQVYTKEFISSLAAYIISRGLKVLEVRAGDGRLSFFLKKYLDNAQIEIITTDIKDWEDRGKANESFEVERIGYEEALEKYAVEPILILSCWMNVDVNWTADFRANPFVKEYILIGDIARTGGYGKKWQLPDNSGFESVRLSRNEDGSRGGVVTGSLGRFDQSPHNPESRSEVYAFRRGDNR